MRRLALLVLVSAAAARADQDNDLQLWRLGHPDELGCARCDGKPGDAREPGTLDAQMRFHLLASTLGLAFVPAFQEPAATIGQSGFELGFSASQAFLRIAPEAWATRAAKPPKGLLLPTMTARKGLGGSFELGVAASWLVQSQMMALSLEARWAPLDGIAYAPDVAVRAFGTRVFGTRELDLTVAGADLSISKSFGVAGMVKLQPYAQGGVVLVNADSAVVDFKPAVENDLNPTADDGTFRTVSLLENRFLRGAAGLRLVAGAVVLGVEGSVAAGENAVQLVPLEPAECVTSDCAIPRQRVRLWSAAARLGLAF